MKLVAVIRVTDGIDVEAVLWGDWVIVIVKRVLWLPAENVFSGLTAHAASPPYSGMAWNRESNRSKTAVSFPSFLVGHLRGWCGNSSTSFGELFCTCTHSHIKITHAYPIIKFSMTSSHVNATSWYFSCHILPLHPHPLPTPPPSPYSCCADMVSVSYLVQCTCFSLLKILVLRYLNAGEDTGWPPFWEPVTLAGYNWSCPEKLV